MPPLDPLVVSLIITLAKEGAAFVAREGRPPTEEEIMAMFNHAAKNEEKFKELLGE